VWRSSSGFECLPRAACSKPPTRPPTRASTRALTTVRPGSPQRRGAAWWWYCSLTSSPCRFHRRKPARPSRRPAPARCTARDLRAPVCSLSFSFSDPFSSQAPTRRISSHPPNDSHLRPVSSPASSPFHPVRQAPRAPPIPSFPPAFFTHLYWAILRKSLETSGAGIILHRVVLCPAGLAHPVGEGQPHRDRGTFPRRALDLHRAVVHLRYPLRDRQPEPVALDLLLLGG